MAGRQLGTMFLAWAALAGTAAESRPLLGAIRWDAWHMPWSKVQPGADDGPVKAVEKSLGPQRYHWRLPFFAAVGDDGRARIDGYTQAIVDQEIAYARAGGLDYWAFLLYEEGSAMSQGLALYLASEHQQDIGFCAIAGANTFGNAQQFPERMQRVVKLMKEPSYQTVGGRPLLYVFRANDDWLNAWGGAGNARTLFDGLRAAVRDAGHGELYLVAMNDSVAEGRRIGTAIGADAISAYARSGQGRDGAPYADLTAVAEQFWFEAAAAGAPVVPLCMAGWDRRPRVEEPVPWERKWQDPGVGLDRYYATPTPAELAAHLETALQWTASEPDLCPAQTALVYAWNEHDEGGWLCPTRGADGRPDTSRLDAIGTMLRDFSPLATIPEPALPKGLLLRLDASDAAAVIVRDGRVTRWGDAVATGSNLTITELGEGRRMVRFGAGENWFATDGVRSDQPVSVFAVTRREPGAETGKYGRILSYYDGQSTSNGQPADWVAPSWCLPIMDDAPYPLTLAQVVAPRIDGLCVGRNMARGDFLHADVGEMLVYDRVLTGPEVDAVRRAMRRKWRIENVLPPG